MPISRWLRWTLGILALSFALFALPARLEGPVLVPISPGHAIAVLDAAATVPLVIASALLYGGLWSARARLRESACRRPWFGVALAFFGGVGLGLLLASVYSGFFGWWAIGAALFAAVVIIVAIHAGRG